MSFQPLRHSMNNSVKTSKRSAEATLPAAASKRANVQEADATLPSAPEPEDATLPPAPEAEVVSPPPKPVLPTSCSDADVNVLDVMRGLIAYVRHHLREHMKGNPNYFAAFADAELHTHLPLGIKATASETELLSFKAPWTQRSARKITREHSEVRGWRQHLLDQSVHVV